MRSSPSCARGGCAPATRCPPRGCSPRSCGCPGDRSSRPTTSSPRPASSRRAPGRARPSPPAPTGPPAPAPPPRSSPWSRARRHASVAPPRESRFDLRPGRPDIGFLDQTAWRRAWRHAASLVPDQRPQQRPAAHPAARGARRPHPAQPGHRRRPRTTCSSHRGSAPPCRRCLPPWGSSGRTVAVEDPGYVEAWTAFSDNGSRIRALPVDDDGLDPAMLRRDRRRGLRHALAPVPPGRPHARRATHRPPRLGQGRRRARHRGRLRRRVPLRRLAAAGAALARGSRRPRPLHRHGLQDPRAHAAGVLAGPAAPPARGRSGSSSSGAACSSTR